MTRFEEAQAYLRANRFTWLVTGAAGFIGSNLVERLLLLNQRVIALDNLATGHRHNVDEAIRDASAGLRRNGGQLDPANFTFIEGDICDLDTCNAACENADFVLHQAAIGSVPRSVEDPLRTNRANIDGFLNVLLAARDAGVKRFVFAASSSTYGDHPDLPKMEDKIGKPLSPYAVTKLVNELYAGVFARVYGFKTIGLRYFNIFGKRQDPQGAYAAVIPSWVASMLKGEEVFINGDGETSRDFCFIENAIQVNLLAALTDNEHALDQIYNVALNHRTSLNQLFEMIQSRLMQRVQSLSKIEPVYRDFRAADVRHSQADISKAEKLLGYSPTHTIGDGLDLAMDWYVRSLTNEDS